MAKKRRKPEEVGVVADKASATLDDRIDRADEACGIVDFVEIGHHRFLVGDGDIDGRKVRPLHKRADLGRGKLAELVGVGGKPPVDLL